jgi:F-type H+-transporting ATPase subunit gamma
MANLKEIRNRISSVKSTRQITSAMKMVSAAKLRRAQDNLIQLRPYTEKLTTILYDISNNLSLIENHPYLNKREPDRVAIVVVTSNKGLCGAFNANVLKQATELLKTTYAELNAQNKVDIISIGKKGSEFFKNKGYNLVARHDAVFDDLTYENALGIINDLSAKFISGHYDKVELIFNRFRNAVLQELRTDQLLPLKPMDTEDERIHWRNLNYIFEPSEKDIMVDLVPKVVRINFYSALLDSFASEHGARMTAMHKATDNATEMMKELSLQYNKARQAAITNEILEIVGGANALKG